MRHSKTPKRKTAPKRAATAASSKPITIFGGVATICPECSYQWTISPMVSISWSCPECGGSRNSATRSNLCVCGHVYEQHHTVQDRKPSREAFGISGEDLDKLKKLGELDKLDEILATEPEPPPQIGHCDLCTCQRFILDHPLLPATNFLHEVDIAAQRGASGRETTVTKPTSEVRCFSKGPQSVRLSIQPDDSILMESLDVDPSEPRILRMGQDTIGMTVIAIHQRLKEQESR